jgi:hypothetical protein
MMAAMTEEHTGGSVAAPETAHVQVALDATGAHGTVVVDGTDLSKRVKAVHLSAEGGRPAEVALVASAGGFSYEGPGIVKVVEEVSTPWARQALAWLDGVDWQDVQRAAASGSMSQPFGECIHGVLAAQLRHLLTGSPDA